jgi:hypothetical protein
MTETLVTLLLWLGVVSADVPVHLAELACFPDRETAQQMLSLFDRHLAACRHCRATYPADGLAWEAMGDYIRAVAQERDKWDMLDSALLFRDGGEAEWGGCPYSVEANPEQAAYYLGALRERIGRANYYQGVMPAPPPCPPRPTPAAGR